MILGQTPGDAGPTAAQPVQFTPPVVGDGAAFPLPRMGFYSTNFSPMWPNRMPMRAYPAYMPATRGGPVPMPSIMPPPVAAAPAAPAPGPTPGGTHGAFGGSGFGSSGGVRAHSHVDPYVVMRNGMIPGVSPSGRNIRAGYANAGARVMASMPYQSAPLPPDPPPPPPMPAVKPAGTNGFGAFSWNPLHWFRSRPNHSKMISQQAHAMFGASNCEWVGPRLDGTMVQICGGRVIQVKDSNGNVLWNAYSNPDAY